jgi:O-antigen/teichoic acid export membrane protein
MPNYAERIAKGTIIIFLMTILSAFVGYVLRMYMARNLTIAEYGLFYTVFIFIGSLMTFRDIGMNEATVKFIPEFIVKKRFDKIKYMLFFSTIFQLIISMLIAIVIFFLSNWLSLVFFKNSMASEILPMMLSFFVIITVFYICKFSFQGFQKTSLLAISDFIYISTTTAAVMIIFMIMGPSISNAAYGYVLGSIASSIICVVLMVRIFPYLIKGKMEVDLDFTKKFVIFSAAIIMFISSNYIMVSIDTLMIAFFKGPEAAGLYQVAAPIAQSVIYIAIAMWSMLFPFISEIWTRGQFNLVSKSREFLLKISFLLTIPICLILLSFPEIVINILFGAKYAGATEALRILSMGFLFYNLGLISVAVMNGMGKPMINTKITIIAAIFNLFANIVLIPLYGIEGAAFATTVAYFIYFVLSQHFLNQEFRKNRIKFNVPYGSMIKTFIGGLATLLVIFLLKSTIQLDVWLKLLAVLIPAFLFYLAWILFSKCIDSEDLRMLKSANLPIPKKLVNIIEKIIR